MWCMSIRVCIVIQQSSNPSRVALLDLMTHTGTLQGAAPVCVDLCVLEAITTCCDTLTWYFIPFYLTLFSFLENNRLHNVRCRRKMVVSLERTYATWLIKELCSLMSNAQFFSSHQKGSGTQLNPIFDPCFGPTYTAETRQRAEKCQPLALQQQQHVAVTASSSNAALEPQPSRQRKWCVCIWRHPSEPSYDGQPTLPTF